MGTPRGLKNVVAGAAATTRHFDGLAKMASFVVGLCSNLRNGMSWFCQALFWA
jgi:hypothetical protein